MQRIIAHLKLNLITVIAAASLTACAGGVVVSQEDVTRNYQPDELRAVATGKNELRTIIVGDPFDISKDAFEQAVLAGLRGGKHASPLNFSTAPKREHARKHHVVLAFNLANQRQADNLCSGSEETAKAANTNGRLAVTGVYCSGSQYLTRAAVRSDNVARTDSEQFRTLMARLADRLFPPANPQNCIWARQVRLCS